MADRSRSPRTLMVADHLWDALSMMAGEMGTDRESLVNQALYMFARLNGFVIPADLRHAPADLRPTASDLRPASGASPPRGLETPLVARPLSAEIEQEIPAAPTPASVAPSAPVAEKATRAPRAKIPDMGDLDPDIPPSATSATPEAVEPVEAAPEGSAAEQGKVLVLMSEGRELERVTKDRFLIGRGKHCDLVINSGKVSREHAAIVRENGAYFIEDLGSSNGTWFEKRRIGRRQIHEGDEYFICAEKLSCTFR
jgi:hypothetical protein